MRWLIAITLACSSAAAFANGALYGELQFSGGAVRHSELDFYPTFGSVNVGYYLVPNVGLELFVDSGLEADDSSDLDMELDAAYGAGLRFESPAMSSLTQGYIVLGVVNYTLTQSSLLTTASAGSAVEEDFTGVRVSVGVMQRLRRYRNFQVTAEYRHYNADEPLRIDALALGIRINTP